MNTIKMQTGETLNLEDLPSLTAWLRQHISVTEAQLDNSTNPPTAIELNFRFDSPVDVYLNDDYLTVYADLAEAPPKTGRITMKTELDLADVAAELSGIAVLINALADKEDIPHDIENGLFAITAAVERLIKEIDTQAEPQKP